MRRAVQMAVRRLNGVGEVTGDWRSRTVTIEYDSESIDVEAIQQAMMVFGYDSTVQDAS